MDTAFPIRPRSPSLITAQINKLKGPSWDFKSTIKLPLIGIWKFPTGFKIGY